MRRVLKYGSWLLAIVTGLLLITGGGTYVYFRQSLPQLAGTIQLAGLHGAVTIVRDENAVPHISATTPADTFSGLGYVHAQDRLWQMEVQRRVGQGRLSEILGDATLSTDRFVRTLGVYRAANDGWATLAPQTRDSINAYLQGVNSFVSTHRGAQLPPEFTILGVKPEPWTGPDVLVWIKMMALDLGGNYDMQLLRRDILAAVGPERARQLLPDYPTNGPTVIRRGQGSSGGQSLILPAQRPATFLHLGGVDGTGIGSNGWVVAGSRTTTGKPILANDPHLSAGMPAIWYLAHLSSGDFDVIGATIPGLPGVIIGRNRTISWGITNLPVDAQDLFREHLSADGQTVDFQGHPEPLRRVTETINVKGQAPVQLVVRITRHGPLLSDELNAENADLPADQRGAPLEPMALQWTALDRTDSTATAFLAINAAQTWDEFRTALQSFVAPALNFIYADTVGNIGYTTAGHIPIRRSGDGTLPAEGWSGTQEWAGWIPFAAMPQSYNPPQGYIVTANNPPLDQGYRYTLRGEWAPPYRAQRIDDLLQAKPKVSPADQTLIQGDTTSLQARELLPDLLALVTPHTDMERQGLELLRRWDGNTRGDSAAAALYETWYVHLLPGLVGDKLGPTLTKRYNVTRFVKETLEDRTSPWCDTTKTPQREDCADLAEQTFQDSLRELQTKLGSVPTQWHWDRVHIAVFPHQPFDNVEVIRDFFNRSIPTGGDGSTVDVGSYSRAHPFEQRFIAGYRQIIDLAKPSGDLFIQASGQSGHVLSPHYADYLADWAALRYRCMCTPDAAMAQHQATTLRLIP